MKFEVMYNYMQRRSRQEVERCLALLKLKFRRLKVIDVHNLEYLSDIIMACCLHNFVLDEQILEPLNMTEFLRNHLLDDDNKEDDDIDFELEN